MTPNSRSCHSTCWGEGLTSTKFCAHAMDTVEAIISSPTMQWIMLRLRKYVDEYFRSASHASNSGSPRMGAELKKKCAFGWECHPRSVDLSPVEDYFSAVHGVHDIEALFVIQKGKSMSNYRAYIQTAFEHHR